MFQHKILSPGIFPFKPIMSLSPSASVSNGSENTSKRRRTNDNAEMSLDHPSSAGPGHGQATQHIPKRGARACTACRKGKNRCEGEVSLVNGLHRPALLTERPASPSRPGTFQAPCRRCAHNGIACVYEKPEKKSVQGLSGASVE